MVNNMETLTTALVTGFTNVTTDMVGAIGSIVPVALPVLAAITVVGLGIKIFKKVTGR